MNLTFLRPDQVGGCITVVESAKGTRIIVDLGHNLPYGDEESPDEFASDEAVAGLTKGAKAIFYTHSHGDHIGLLEYVPEGIDQYLGPLAHEIMTARYAQMTRYDALKETSYAILRKLKPFKTYCEGQEIRIDDIAVTPFQVNHSATDAYMLKICCDGETILHTGDYRCHGYDGDGIIEAIGSIRGKGDIDVLITEGTNIGNEETMKTESALKEEFKEVFKTYKNTFVLCSSTDADRLLSVYNADIEGAKRPFVTDKAQKHLLGLIDARANGRNRIYRFDRRKIYGYDPTVEKMEKMLRKHGFVMLIRRSGRFQEYLDRILPFCKPEETCCVFSQYHGYIDPENENAFSQKTFDFIQQFTDKGFAFKEIHTSGHAMKEDIVRVCAAADPKAIIAIHRNPDSDIKTILPDELKSRVSQ